VNIEFSLTDKVQFYAYKSPFYEKIDYFCTLYFIPA